MKEPSSRDTSQGMAKYAALILQGPGSTAPSSIVCTLVTLPHCSSTELPPPPSCGSPALKPHVDRQQYGTISYPITVHTPVPPRPIHSHRATSPVIICSPLHDTPAVARIENPAKTTFDQTITLTAHDPLQSHPQSLPRRQHLKRPLDRSVSQSPDRPRTCCGRRRYGFGQPELRHLQSGSVMSRCRCVYSPVASVCSAGC